MKQLDEKAKKMLLLFGVVIGAIVLIIFIVFLVGLFKNKSLEYREIEDKMVEAARKYYAVKEDALPLNEDEKVEVSTTLLAEEGYMKELVKYQKDESVSCSGKVIVTKTDYYYYYSPYLECGDKYTTTYLHEKLLETVISKGDGLYKTTQYFENKNQSLYIYKGEYPLNYIKIGEDLFRIVKINPDNTIMIIQHEPNDDLYIDSSWDDRYNTDTEFNDGINNFNTSRIKRRLDIYYSNEKYFSSELKQKLVAKKVCVGPRSITDNKNDGSIECRQLSEDAMYFSILPIYDFLNASLDKNCKLAEDRTCSNYNYLNRFNEIWWLLTTNSKATYRGYVAQSAISRKNLSYQAYVRAVAYLNSNVLYYGGSGTYSDPYIVK